MKLIKIPFNGASMNKRDGQELAPDAICSHFDEMYCNEVGVKTDPSIASIDIDNNNVEESFQLIEKELTEIFGKATEKICLIGGDHSISYPAFRAFAKGKTSPGLIVFDAHPDCMHDFKPPTHEDWLRVLIEEQSIKPEHIILVGIRSCDKQEIDFLKTHNIRYFTMKQIAQEGIQQICDIIMENARLWSDLYLSVDIDAVDPGMAPGTGYCEPGGLASRELLYCIQRLRLLKNLSAVDIVEINPKRDINAMTSKLGAKLIRELF